MDLTAQAREWPLFARLVATGGLAILAGASVGWLATRGSPIVVLGLVLLPVVAVAYLRSLWVGLIGVLAIAVLLPYAVFPVGAVVTPALLETATIALIVVTAAVVLLDHRERIPVNAEMAWLVLLVGIVVGAFLLGLGRGYSPQIMHDFFKFLLAFMSFSLVLQLVRTMADIRLVILTLVSLVTGAAGIALVLYAGGASLTERVLVRLVPYGYPGSRIARFIEDDPARPMRAVGTSVDPNSFGGLLMVGFVLSAGQLLVRRRMISVPLAVGASFLTGTAMLLTYSRGAWVGAVAGLTVVVLLRRRWLIGPAIGVGATVVLLGIGSGFVERLWLGFTLQDPATRLRLSEYRNAWEIIQLHPWFGVGFGSAPSIELQTGVSSIYLTIARRVGLIGLAAFLIVAGLIAWRGLLFSVRDTRDEASDTAVCVLGAFIAALTVGLVDHYFFNPLFPHMATLFWTIGGLLVAIPRVTMSDDHTVGGFVNGTVSSPEYARDIRTALTWTRRSLQSREDQHHA